MNHFTASAARANLYRLLDEVARSHCPVHITGRRSNGVLLSEQDWLAIEATLHLQAIPGMRESINRGLKTPAGECKTAPGW